MTILVTGAAGLVGTHVLEMLRARGERPRALVREHSRSVVEALGAEAVIGDVTDAVTWQHAAAGVDAIIHTAAIIVSRQSFEEFSRVNVGGTRLALEAARRERARLIHVSSVAVYGRREMLASGEPRVTEDYPFQPLPPYDFYARSKRAAEQLVEQESKRDALSAVAIRPNVIYGERDRLFTKRVIALTRLGLVPRVGAGRNQLSCVYAGNVAAAILTVLEAPASSGFRAYNVTQDAGLPLTQREFLAEFAHDFGRQAHFIPLPVPLLRSGFAVWSAVLKILWPRRYAGLAGSALSFVRGDNPYSSERIQHELNWTPPFDTRAAIAQAVGWFRHKTKSPGGARA